MSGRLESFIEAKCCKLAEKCYRVDNIKLIKATGYPDRLFFKDGKILFVEFKQPGKKLRPIQLYRHHQLMEAGFIVNTVDNEQDFLNLIETIWTKK